MAETLKEKTVSGIIWTGFQKIGSTLLSFVSTIVLARLLTPEDYGYIGMLAIFISVSSTFIDGGFGSALIQKKHPTDEDYSTIFFWNLGLSVFLYFILFSCAPLIARFYRLPLLCVILRIEGIVLIVNAVRIVHLSQLRKQLRFKVIATVDLSVSAISLAVTIYLAWKGYGVWALVIQQLMVSTLTTAAYWVTGHWLPILVFSRESFMRLFGFGGFILLSNLVNSFCNNIQGLLIGRFYNPATMGYYSKARGTEQIASTFIASVIDQVSFPVLSEAQNDLERMQRMLQKFIGVLAFFSFPAMIFLILLAKPLFLLLYSERWMASVPYFQILCLAGIAICLQGINYYAVAAIGKSNTMFKATIFKRSVGLLFILAGLFLWGMRGLLLGVVLDAYVIYIVNAYLVHRFIGYKLWRQLIDLLPIILISLLSGLVVYIVGLCLPFHQYLVATIQLFVFVLFYLFFSFLLRLPAYKDSMDIVRGLLQRVTK